MSDIFEQKGKRGARAKRPKPAKASEPVVMDEEDAISAPAVGCPIIGHWIEAKIERGTISESRFGGGTELSLLFRFDDSTLPNEVNGKTIYSKIKLSPKSKVMTDFCRFLHRRQILEFSEEFQKSSPDGGKGLMRERLIANLEDVVGVWEPDSRELVGGKIQGHRCNILVGQMIEWPASDKFRDNYYYKVSRPSEAHEGGDVVFSIFEVSRIMELVSEPKFVGDKSADVVHPQCGDDSDEVPF